MADKTISYKGKRIKVNERDRVLYTMVKQGLITEADLTRLQKAISSSTSASQTVIDVRHNFRSGFSSSGGGGFHTQAQQEEVLNALGIESAAVPSTDIGANLTSAQEKAAAEGVTPEAYAAMSREEKALAKYEIGGGAAEAMLEMLRAGLIDWNGFQTLTYIADEEWGADQVYGLAVEEFDISDAEWDHAATGNIPDADELNRRLPNLGERARQFGRWSQREERERELMGEGGLERVITDPLKQFVSNAEVKKAKKNAILEAIKQIPESELSQGDRDKIKHKLNAGKFDDVEEIIGSARKYIDDESVLAAFDTAAAMPSTIEEADAAAEAAAEITEPETFARMEQAIALGEDVPGYLQVDRGQVERPTVLGANNLRTVEDFAAYQGIIPLEEQMAPDVIVEGGGLGLLPGFEQDIPENYFYDSATGKAYDAQAYQRLLQGQSAFQQEFQWDPGAEGPMTEYFTAKTRPLGLRGEKAQAAYRSMFSYGDEAMGAGGAPGAGPIAAGNEYNIGTILDFDPVAEPWLRQSWSSLHPGSARVMADNMGPAERRLYERKFADNGLDLVFSEDDGSPIFRNPNTDAQFVQMLGLATQVARGQDISPYNAIGVLGVEMQRQRSMQQASLAAARSFADAMTIQKQPFQVPAGLRSIPSQKEIAQDVKERFRVKLGRDPTMVELDDLAAELTGYHQTSTRDQIDLAYAEWEGSSNIMDGADLEEVISNPALVSTFDMEQKWANEINLNERQEVNAESFNRIRAATGGTGASLGALPTSGTNVVGV